MDRYTEQPSHRAGTQVMDLQTIINAEYGIRTGLALARVMPTSAGYTIAKFMANRITSQRDQPMVKAMRANQWVASGGKLSATELDEVVRVTFQNRAKSIFDFYHSLQQSERMLAAVDFGPEYLDMLERSRRRETGTVVVVPHVSNYELVGIASALKGGKGVALTYPEQTGGYKRHDHIRKQFGIEAIPASMASYKYAVRELREGGTIVTGADRPLPDSGYRPMFFGRQTALPVHHVSLALRARVPAIVACVGKGEDGRYNVAASEFITMKEYGDRRTEIIANAERILEISEHYIKRDLQQWAMFFPLWPDVVP